MLFSRFSGWNISRGGKFRSQPASCTDQLQPLDQIINKKYKDDIKKQFQLCYADEFAKLFKDKKSGNDDERSHVKID